MLCTVRPWYDAMLPRAGEGCGGCDEEGVSWADCGAGDSAAIDSAAMVVEAGEQRAAAGAAKVAASASAARAVSNACLKRKPAPQYRGGRLSVSMNRYQTMLYWLAKVSGTYNNGL